MHLSTFLLLLAMLICQISSAQSDLLQTPNSAFEPFNQGEALYIKGNYEAAQPFIKDAAKAYASNKEAQVMALTLQGLALLRAGKKEKAYPFLNEAELLFKENKIKRPEAIVTLKFGLGAYHWSYKEKKEAEQLLNEAEQLLQKSNAPLPLSIGIEFYELLGEIAKSKGAYPQAIEHYNKAIENAEKLPVEKRHRENYALDKMVVGELYDLILAPEEAVQKYQKILEKKTDVIQDDVDKEIELNFRIGASFFKRKQYEIAVSYLEDALKLIQNTSKNLDRKPAIQAMLATIETDQRRYETAIINNSNALKAWKTEFPKDDLFRLYTAHLHQGLIFRKIAPEFKGLVYYKQTVDESEKDWAAVLERKAIIPIQHLTIPKKTEAYNWALLSYLKAEDLIPQFDKKQHQILNIDIHMAKGALFFEACDYPRAKYHFQTALDLMKSLYSEKHPLVAEASRMLGEVYLAEQLFDEALSFVDKALNASMEAGSEVDAQSLPDISKTNFPIELLNAISTKGVILYNQEGEKHTEKTLRQVLHLYDLAVTLLNNLRKTYRNEGAQYRLAEIAHKFSQQAITACEALYQLNKDIAYLDQAFQYAELSKSAVLLEAIRDLKAREVAGIPKEKIVAENELKVEIAYLKGEVFYELKQGPNKDLARLIDLENKVKEKSLEHENIVLAIEKEHPKYHSLKYNYTSKSIADLQKVLKDNEVFIDYIVTDTFIYALAVSKTQTKSHLARLKNPLTASIQKLRAAIKLNKANDFSELGYSLYEQTIAPFKDFIQGKKLILSLDGPLNYIPFGILPTHRLEQISAGSKAYPKTTFLIENHSICYNYSGNLFIHSYNKNPLSPSKKVGAWAPNFDSVIDELEKKGFKFEEELEELPGAKNESKNIANLFGEQAILNEMATEIAFKNTAKEYGVLHVATHGLLMDNAPLFSSLVFNNTADEDGLLHTYELYNLELNADLVVLSACNSGIGTFTKGEGVISLARGFAYAGTPNIVMSTWPVSDWSTEVLMKSFYNNLKKGLPKDEALQQAKVSFLEDNKDRDKILAPFFWGGFILSGNTAPVVSLIAPPTNYWVYIGIAAVVVLLLALVIFFKKRSTNTQTA